MDYTVFTEPVLGMTAGKETNFEIAGYEIVRMHIKIDKMRGKVWRCWKAAGGLFLLCYDN